MRAFHGGLAIDFDGTIIDSETSAFWSWKEVHARRGVTLEIDEWLPCVGRGGVPWAANLAEATGDDADDIQRERDILKAEHAAREPARSGIINLLEIAQDRRVGIAVVSNSLTGWVEGHLERLGIRSLVDIVVTAEGVEPKPAPAIYLKASDLLGLSVSDLDFPKVLDLLIGDRIDDIPFGPSLGRRSASLCRAFGTSRSGWPR